MKKTLLLIAFTTLCFAATESRVPRSQILKVEGMINQRFSPSNAEPYPYDLLGNARGTYLEGYGAVFTLELQLTTVAPLSPFRPAPAPGEVAAIHDRKAKKLPLFKTAMRELLASGATTLDSLPPNEHIAMEAILFYYSFENSRDLPKRVFMTVEKDKLLEAEAKHLDLASVIEEQER